MTPAELATVLLTGLGAIFFFAGTVGLLRFPDVHARLHALTKADNLGLGLVVAGLLLQADSVAAAAKLFLIWLLVISASATATYLIANRAHAGSRASTGAPDDVEPAH